MEKGDLIASFDRDEALERLENLQAERQVILARSSEESTRMENRQTKLLDELMDLQAQRAVQEARLTRLQSLPSPIDVELALKKRDVSKMIFDAAERDLERGRDRFSRNMIAASELDSLSRARDLFRAQLDHAEEMLKYTKWPASRQSLRLVELEMSILDLDIDRLKKELEDITELIRIQVEAAKSQKKSIDSRVERQQEEVDHSQVLAPAAGTVSYLRSLRSVIISGDKLHKNSAFLAIPDPESLVLKATIPEAQRPFFAVGDKAEVVFTGHGGEVLGATLSSIESRARALSDREENEFRWGEKKAEGLQLLKVHDCTLSLTSRPPWLTQGLHAEVEMVANTPVRGVAAPITHVLSHEGLIYLAEAGIYRPVTGRILQDLFYLEDATWAGRSIGLQGRFETSKERPPASTQPDFEAQGELVPLQAVDVSLKSLWRWAKVVWLLPENSVVKEGADIVRLDTQEIDDEIDRQSAELKRQEGEHESLVKNLEIEKRSLEFDLTKQEYQMEQAKIRWKLRQEGADVAGLLRSRLSLREADIRLAQARRNLELLESKQQDFISARERAEVERGLERRRLEHEAAKLRNEAVERGYSPVEISRAHLDYIEMKTNHELTSSRLDRFLLSKDRRLAGSQRSIRRKARELKNLEQHRENLTVRAPASGTLHFEKVWNNGVISKISLGTLLGSRFKIMRISDNLGMSLRVELPESIFAKVQRQQQVNVSIPSRPGLIIPGVVDTIEFLFLRKQSNADNIGLYSSHESAHETVFYVRVLIDQRPGENLSPGTSAMVRFPLSRDGG